MRPRLTLLLVAAAAALSAPAAAMAAAAPPHGTPADASTSATAASAAARNEVLFVTQGSPTAQVENMSTVPIGFHSSAGQAVAAAERIPTLQALHRRMHPLQVIPFVWRSVDAYWYVVFSYRGKIVADANVNKAGKVTGYWTGAQADAPYTHGDWSWALDSLWIYIPASLLFMLTFVDPRRLWRIAYLDGLAVLAFLVSYGFLAQTKVAPAVWLVYPPLIYLLVRMVAIGFGRTRSPARLAPLLSNRLLVIGLPVLLGARIVLSLVGHQEIDVGYESVIGAYRILHHLPIYYNDPNHGDTYGPVTYLAYVPFDLLFPWTNSLSNLHAADAAAIFFDLGTVVGLLLLGRRLRPGSQGTRLGLVLAWAWAACPFTILALIVHTNDALVAMLSVFAMVAIATPAVSGMLLGLATAAKFSPGALLPLLAAPRRRGWKGALVCVSAFTIVVALAVYSWLPPAGFGYFWQRTLEFQITRLDIFSPWALHPTLKPIQTVLEALALVLAGLVAFVPRDRSLARVCALAGAVTIAIQLPATHWYYYYIVWFIPFVLVGFLVRPTPADERAPDEAPSDETITVTEAHEPVLAGV